jgi:general stress protein YciG
MTSLARKFGLTIAAALALALAPGLSCLAWGQANPPAKTDASKKADSKKDAKAAEKQVTPAEALKKADQLKTEAGRRAAAQEAQKAEEAKAKEAASKGGKAAGDSKSQAPPAPPTSGFIVEKGDPFVVPIKPPPSTSNIPKDLPPGQAGLLVSQADLQGIVKLPDGYRAIVRGPGTPERIYFLKVNDKIYSARVTKITDDTIYFEETTVNPLGQPQKREIAKSLPSEKKP